MRECRRSGEKENMHVGEAKKVTGCKRAQPTVLHPRALCRRSASEQVSSRRSRITSFPGTRDFHPRTETCVHIQTPTSLQARWRCKTKRATWQGFLEGGFMHVVPISKIQKKTKHDSLIRPRRRPSADKSWSMIVCLMSRAKNRTKDGEKCGGADLHDPNVCGFFVRARSSPLIPHLRMCVRLCVTETPFQWSGQCLHPAPCKEVNSCSGLSSGPRKTYKPPRLDDECPHCLFSLSLFPSLSFPLSPNTFLVYTLSSPLIR